MIPVFERVKILLALGRAATVIGMIEIWLRIREVPGAVLSPKTSIFAKISHGSVQSSLPLK
jgi:hypothetical protein